MRGIKVDGRLYTLVRNAALDSLDSVIFLRHLLPHVADKRTAMLNSSQDSDTATTRQYTTMLDNEGGI
jgi:hypothetical protein